MPIYNLNNKKYNIPDDVVADFERDYPDATISYKANDLVYNIPVNKKGAFLNRYPNASLYDERQEQQSIPSNTITDGVGTQEEADKLFELNEEIFNEKNPNKKAVLEMEYDKLKNDLKEKEQDSFRQQLEDNGEIQRLENIKAKAQIDIDKSSFFDRFFNPETRAAVAARDKAEEALETYQEANRNDDNWVEKNVGGVLRGIFDKVGDLRTWDFGASGIASGVALKDVVDKLDNGEELTPAEQNMLDAFGLSAAVQSAYQDKVGTAYNVGGSLPESASFMASLALNPAGGVGRKIAEKAAKSAVKKYGTTLVGKLAKGAARVGGDIVEMGVATAIPGAGRVAEDYYNRLNGQSTFDVDDNGLIRYGGQIEQEEADDAIWKAFGSQFIENYSEAMGNYFAPMGNILSNLTSKGLKAAHLGKVAEAISDISSSQWSKGIQRFKDAVKFDGLVGEYMEEVAGNVMNAATVGDMNFNAPDDPRSVFNPETNIETFLSCALMSGTMYAVEAPVTLYNKYIPKRNLRNADNAASELLGNRWEDLRNQIDEADLSHMAQILTGVENATDLSLEQKQAIKNYASKLVQYQAYNSRKVQDAQEATPEANEAENVYNEGTENTTHEYVFAANRAKVKAENALKQADESVYNALNEAMATGQPVEAFLNSLNGDVATLARDYYNKELRVRGTLDAVKDKAEEEIARETKIIKSVSDPKTGIYAEVSRIDHDEQGNEVLVPGYITGWIGEGENRTPIFLEEGAENTQENRKPLKPSQYKAETIQEMPMDEVISVMTSMIRDNAAKQAEQEAKYAPDVLNAQMQQGIPFEDETAVYVPFQVTPEGNAWQVEVYNKDENGKPSKDATGVNVITNDQFRDMLQAQYEANEAAQQQQSVQEVVPTIEEETTNTPVATEEVTQAEEVQPEVVEEEVQQPQQQAPVIPTKEDGSIDFVSYGKDNTFKTLGEKYGEKMPNKVAVTAKALAEDLVKAQEKLSKAEEAYDNAPIGREQKAEQARDKAKAELESIQREADFWSSLDNEIKEAQAKRDALLNPKADVDMSEEPMNADEFIAQQLANGNIVLESASYKKETGYGEKERQKFIKMFRKTENGGMTIEGAGDLLMQMDRENGTNFFDHTDANAGRDALINFLGSVSSWGDVTGYIRNNREAQAAKETESLRSEMEDVIEANYHMTPEEYATLQEMEATENPFEGVDIEAKDAIFAEAALEYEEYLKSLENGQGTTEEVIEGNGDVLSEEQSDNTGGTEQRQGEGHDVSEGTVQSDDAAQEESAEVSYDNQGNPVDIQGNLITETVSSINEITDEDFIAPKRSVVIPNIPQKVSDAIGTEGKPLIIKKNIFEKNRINHKDLTPIDGRKILEDTLFNPNLYGQNQKATRPYNWILIHLADKHSAVIVEVNQSKDFVEIVNWHYLNDATLEQKKNQAIREGGLILTFGNAAGNASDRLVSENKDSNLSKENKENQKNVQEIPLSEAEYADKRSEEILKENPNIDDVDAYNKALDEYPSYIGGMIRSGYLEDLYAKSSIKDRIALGDIVRSAGYEVSDISKKSLEDSKNNNNNKHSVGEKVIIRYLDGTLVEGVIEKANQGKISVRSVRSGRIYTVSEEKIVEYSSLGDDYTLFREAESTLERAERIANEEARRKPLRQRAKEWEQKLGVKVNIIENFDDVTNKDAKRAIRNGQRVTGWYEESTGEVCLYMPYLESAQEIDATYIHEVVAHKGLRGLLGDKFDEFLDDVWNAMSEADKLIYLTYPGVNGNKRAAADEYIAHLAENIDVTESAWGKLAELIKKFLKAIGLEPKMTHADIANTIKRSYQRLAESGNAENVGGGRTRLRTLEEINQTFNEELQQQIDGTLPNGHIYQLGSPSAILLSTGIADVPIELNSTRLEDKSKNFGHDYDLSELKDLVKAIHNPMAIFAYGDKSKAQNIIVEIQHEGKNFIVGLSIKPKVGGQILDINSIRNVFPKDNAEWLNWISQGKLLYADKERIQDLINQQQTNLADVDYLDLDSIANIINDFQNPTLPEEKTLFKVVYHGSGASFVRFDHAFMGTGEGAQAYGWGTYVTDVEGIGKQYAERMRPERYHENAVVNNLAKEILDSFNGDKEKALEYLRSLLNESWSDKKRVKKEIKIIESGKYLPLGKVHLYEVEIPDNDDSNFIDWQTNNSQGVIEKLNNAYKNMLIERGVDKDDISPDFAPFSKGISGESIYKLFARELGSDKEASKFLGRQGFIGIEYPAQFTTGGRADNAKNYVIFNEKDLEIKGHTRFRTLPNIKLRKLEEGEKCNVERVFTQQKMFNFSSGEKIKSYEDVAYIFKSLEDEAIENTFVALIKNGKPTIVHLGMGTANQSTLDQQAVIVAIDRIKPDEVYMVHNHPSGNLKASRQDVVLLDSMKKAYGPIVKDGIIINLRSGRYSVFNEEGSYAESNPSTPSKEIPVKTYSFSKRVFDKDFDIQELINVRSADDANYYAEKHGLVAALTSSQRLGDRDKISLLVIDQSGKIVGNVFLNHTDVTPSNMTAISKDIAYYTSAMSGQFAIIFGRMNIKEAGHLNMVVQRVSAGSVKMFDAISVNKDGGYVSAANEGVMEEAVDYANNDTRFRIAPQAEVQAEVDKFTSKYNSKPVELVDFNSSDSELEEIFNNDFTAEEIKEGVELNKIKGGYAKRYDKIYIFAHKQDASKVEETLFHENLHVLLSDGSHSELVDRFYSSAKDDKSFARWRRMSDKDAYNDDERAEEFFCYVVSNGQVSDNLEDVFEYLTSKEQNELKELLNINGYDYDNRRFNEDFREENKRGSERENIESDLRGRGLESQEKGQGRRFKEGKERLERESIRMDIPQGAGQGERSGKLRNVSESNGKRSKEQAERLKKLFDDVADMGLRGVLGNTNYDLAMLDIFYALPEKERIDVAVRAVKIGGDVAVSVDEFLNNVEEPTLLEKVIASITNALRKVGINVELTENDVKYLLWRSRKPLDRNSIFDMAEDINMRRKLKVGEFDNDPTDGGDTPGGGTRFRVANKLQIRDEYESTIKKGGYQAREAVQDAMLSLRRTQELIEKASGKKLRGFENAWEHEIRLSSVVQAEIHEMERKFYKPMMDAVKKLANAMGDKNDYAVADYLMLKHGIERNREMAVRKALTDTEGKIDRTQLEQWYKDKDAIRNDANLPTWREKQEAMDNAALNYGADMSVDYSGLTSMFGSDDLADCTDKAYKEVEELEWLYPYETKALGKAVKALNQSTIDKSFESGLMDRKVRDELKNDMYDYYVPLRGFDEVTSDEVYSYLDNDRNAFNAPLRRAKGRTSKADNPIAYMKSIAESGIMQGERNKMKQSFLNMVTNHPSDLVSVREGVWVVLNPATGEWEAASMPTIPNNATPADVESTLEAWETSMEQQAATNPNIKKISEGADIPYRVIGNRMEQHQVIVKRNGKSYTLTVNGNPRLAMALNGLTNPNNTSKDGIVAADIQKAVDKMNRTLAAWYTTRNPDFVASNFMRDTFYTNTIVRAKEGNKYANKFHKHYAELLMPGKMLSLFNKYENGKLDMNNKTEKAFYDFIMNGGETGYSNLKDIEHIKNEIANQLKGDRLKWFRQVSDKLDLVNRAVENTSRFAAFITSREMGRDMSKSIFDAKEISVNFNKKGAGGTFYKGTGQTKFGNLAAMVGAGGRGLYVFFNAAIQGSTNLLHVMKVNPKGTSAGLAAMFLMGAVLPYLLSGDDDKDYYDLPDHVRRNHLVLPGAGDTWVSIPLPIEYRIMYGMGELFTSWRTGHERGSNVALKALSLTGQALPLNFLEEGLDAFVPSALSPLWQAYNNRSWTGLPIYKDNEFNKDDPEYTKAYKNVDRLIYNFTKSLYDWTFDEENQEEGIDLNPAVIESLARGYFGGLFTQMSNIVKTAETIGGDREFDWRNIPVGNRIFKSGDERTKEKRITNEYFDNMGKLDFLESRRRMLNRTIDGKAVPEEDVEKAKADLEQMMQTGVYQKYMKFKEYKKVADKIRKAMKDNGSTEELQRKLSEAQEKANEVLR